MVGEDMIVYSHLKAPILITEPNSVLVAKAALARGFSVAPLRRNMFRVTGNGKSEIFNLTMASSISHVARAIAWDKQLTKNFFSENNVPTPAGVSFTREEISKATDFMRASGSRLFVLKPLGGVLGSAVFMNVSSKEMLEEKCAETPPRYKRMILEEQVSGIEARYLVVGNEVVAVAERRPANVVGDGANHIAGLIEYKNRSRQKHPGLEQINVDKVTQDLIREQGFTLSSIPPRGREIVLKRVSNISQGGDSVDMTDEVHESIKNLAVSALKSIPFLTYAGLDIIAEDHRAPLGSQRAVVLEANWHPMIRIHHAPAIGKPRDVAGSIIEFLFQ